GGAPPFDQGRAEHAADRYLARKRRDRRAHPFAKSRPGRLRRAETNRPRPSRLTMPASRFNPLRSLQRDLGRRAAERETLTQGIAAHDAELQRAKEEMAR